MAHTPGPWYVDAAFAETEGIVIRPGNSDRNGARTGYGLATIWPRDTELRCDAYSSECCGGSPEANARLIAAAPELLDVARKVMEWWDEHECDSYIDREGEEYNTYNEDPQMVVAARAAIAKAEGDA